MLDQYDMSISLSQTKNHLKTALLQNQYFYDKTNWHPSHGFNFEMIAKIEYVIVTKTIYFISYCNKRNSTENWLEAKVNVDQIQKS